MRSRQRGAAWLLGLLLAGRLLDVFDLPFERQPSARLGPGARSTPLDSAAVLRATPSAAAPVATRARPDSTPPAVRSAPDSTPVAINRATPAELQRLPGVGPVLAGRILAHRLAHGPFRNLADLQAVRGIGPHTCARLAPRVRFD